ncbi:MAG: DnaJ domain-containing protein [Acidobacteriia bacterium]|nr:DnaJ domain-containing protein [Terriglobia bacterium]
MDRPADTFIDYYELMQISPNADMETVQRVYRMLAARYHPDNSNTGDMERFLRLTEAYRTLSDPPARAAYDADYRAQHLEPMAVFNLREFAMGIDGESNRRMGVLCLLYNRRRVSSEEPGLSLLEFEKLMSSPREHLVFTIWYLKDKGYIRQTEDSSYAITGAGVDYVEAGLPKNGILYKLIKEAEDGSAVRSAASTILE